MQRRPCRNYTPVFKSKVALATIKGDKTVAELAQQLRCTRQPDHYSDEKGAGNMALTE